MVTAIARLLGNALDVTQHLLHTVAPPSRRRSRWRWVPFYLVWFPMLAHDFLWLAKREDAQ